MRVTSPRVRDQPVDLGDSLDRIGASTEAEKRLAFNITERATLYKTWVHYKTDFPQFIFPSYSV